MSISCASIFTPFSHPRFLPSRFHRCAFFSVASLQKPINPWETTNSAMAANIIPPMAGNLSSLNREAMVPPYNVLITGSTKGIGYALAKEFLKAGDNVLVCSRSVERVESTIQSLREEFGEQHVWGTKCDVREGQDVKDLVAFAKENLKYIDLWINNAGSNAYSYKPLAEASDEDLIEVVSTNTLGLMICCREAIKMMLNQPRGGRIFNIDGAGSDGRPTPRFAAYGATKRSVVHLTKSLQPLKKEQWNNNTRQETQLYRFKQIGPSIKVQMRREEQVGQRRDGQGRTSEEDSARKCCWKRVHAPAHGKLVRSYVGV
ncbi:chlorophyll(ide) b reductase NOL, chloroplastic isoform X3 [Hevea brasiliensis]|uniref:chlorophyll(ide) b reductase NOL, chloroplastic isoform X3 n=1 Tax=Hevea brasiliensis TaxID=3981 RepID=UPI0025E3A9C7|nr:chlorophyll(ide) b reductase NOL, chloroplastic isoform X3 [Hevea brasiliensis]